MADIHNCGLTRSTSGLLESSEYSDMTVRCGSEEFKLHRAIVCPRSRFFAAACDGQFQEAKTSTIVLEEDDPPTVRRMLTYLYTLAYDDEGDAASAQHYMVNGTKLAASQAQTTMTTPLSEEEILIHAKMMNNVVVHAIAQKYDIGELKELATVRFRELLWVQAPSHGLPDVIDAVFETTSSTDPGLRNIAVKFCTHYSTQIVADDRLCSIIKHHGELGLDVLRKVDEYAVENCGQKELLHKKLATLKGELAQMMSSASSIEMPTMSDSQYWICFNATKGLNDLQQKLKMAYDSFQPRTEDSLPKTPSSGFRGI